MRNTYQLTPFEVQHVEYVARMSEVRSKERIEAGVGKGEKYGGAARNAWMPDKKADGFAAEIVVARLYGDTKWLPKPVPKGKFVDDPDAGGRGGVRQAVERWKSLILHKPEEGDPEWMPFHLVFGHRHEEMELHGWIYGYEGQIEKYWKTTSRSNPDTFEPAYFVPRSHPFHDPEHLPYWWRNPRPR